jgi:hypothetical protein
MYNNVLDIKRNEALHFCCLLDPNSRIKEKINTLTAETEDEIKNCMKDCIKKRQIRLILGGKMKPRMRIELKHCL